MYVSSNFICNTNIGGAEMGIFGGKKKCVYHSDREAVNRCNHCEQPICADCAVVLQPMLYCVECAPKVFAGEVGGACPLCKADGTLHYSGKERDTFLCKNCSAEFTGWDECGRSRLVCGKSDYVGKLLITDLGWKVVRDGGRLFVCPRCSVQQSKFTADHPKPEKVKEGTRLTCDNCLVELRVEGGQLVEEVSEKVASSVKYWAVKWGTPVESIIWTWPSRCCVCLGPAEKAGSMRTEFTDPGLLALLQPQPEMEARGLPYCGSCYKKARGLFSGPDFKFGFVTDRYHKEVGLFFGFRNPEYARMFRDLNACYEQGMVPISIEKDRLVTQYKKVTFFEYLRSRF